MFFIRYHIGMKCYKLYDLNKHHTFVFRDMIFHEYIFPFQKLVATHNPHEYVQLFSKNHFVWDNPMIDIYDASFSSHFLFDEFCIDTSHMAPITSTHDQHFDILSPKPNDHFDLSHMPTTLPHIIITLKTFHLTIIPHLNLLMCYTLLIVIIRGEQLGGLVCLT